MSRSLSCVTSYSRRPPVMAGAEEGTAVTVTRQWNVAIPGQRRGASHDTEVTLHLLDEALRIAPSIATSSQTKTKRILFEDLLGIRICNDTGTGQAACTAEIHSLPVVKRKDGKNYRTYSLDRIVFSDGQNFELNRRRAQEWKTEVMKQCHKAVRSTFFNSDEADLEDACCGKPLGKQKLLVLVNPASGSGKSVKLFKGKVRPLFDVADIELDFVTTEWPGHAKSVVASYDLSQIDGIVVSSGDGLIYEVINGLMSRADKQTAIKTPLGHIPTGSGNALCCSLHYQNGEDMSLASAALQIIRGGVEAVDLATVQTKTNETSYMLLLAQWGMLADIDIESERLRRLGGKTRDILGALKCIAQRRTYKGLLHYLPVSASEEQQASASEEQQASASEQEKASGSDVQGEKQHQSVHTTQEQEEQQHENSTEGKEDHSTSPSNEASLPSHACTPCVPTLLPSPVTHPVPESWQTVEGVFIAVTVLMAPVMGDGFVGHPNIALGSGEFTILYFHDNVSRAEMLTLLKDGDTGNWINHPKVHIIKAKAYRIEPVTHPGLMTLDGEVIEYGVSQAQVHRHVARVFSRKRIANK